MRFNAHYETLIPETDFRDTSTWRNMLLRGVFRGVSYVLYFETVLSGQGQ
jgi:hypothetical protein